MQRNDCNVHSKLIVKWKKGLRELQGGHKVLEQDFLLSNLVLKLYDQTKGDGFCGRVTYFLSFYFFEFVPYILHLIETIL